MRRGERPAGNGESPWRPCYCPARRNAPSPLRAPTYRLRSTEATSSSTSRGIETKPQVRARWVCIAAALTITVSSACNRSPIGPTNTFPHLNNACQIPVDAMVRCSATLIDRIRFGSTEDVTAIATWSVEPTDVAMFTAPGVLSPLRHGEATLSVAYEQWTTNVLSTFLVDPSATARWLYFVQFTSVENDGQTRIPGVTIEITHSWCDNRDHARLSGRRVMCDEYGRGVHD